MTKQLFVLVGLGLVASCGDDPCNFAKNTGCDDGQACEMVQGNTEATCVAAVVVTGRIFDLGTDKGIANARIVALDPNGAAVSSVAVSSSDGTYSLPIPTLRNADGSPSTSFEITLRADAKGYLTFPAGIRPALPFNTANPVLTDGRYVVKSALTDVALLPLEANTATGIIKGTVADNATNASVLVVAEVGGKGYSAIAGRDGGYAILNVPPGDATVTAYALGHNYTPATATVVADKSVDVNLAVSDAAPSTVTGTVQIVNGQLGTATSVILVVESTFDEAIVRGETPAGLRAPQPGMVPDITGAFSIAGVPAGRYVVLAGFENDNLVRDASSIGGTAIVHQEVVAGQDVTLATSFKVTGAVDIVMPGADGPQLMEGNPTFEWLDDSSEDHYAITVFNGYGTIVWEATTPRSIVTLPYAGPALESGMYYQFRVQSIKDPAEQISKSEDLKGVFYLP